MRTSVVGWLLELNRTNRLLWHSECELEILLSTKSEKHGKSFLQTAFVHKLTLRTNEYNLVSLASIEMFSGRRNVKTKWNLVKSSSHAE